MANLILFYTAYENTSNVKNIVFVAGRWKIKSGKIPDEI